VRHSKRILDSAPNVIYTSSMTKPDAENRPFMHVFQGWNSSRQTEAIKRKNLRHEIVSHTDALKNVLQSSGPDKNWPFDVAETHTIGPNKRLGPSYRLTGHLSIDLKTLLKEESQDPTKIPVRINLSETDVRIFIELVEIQKSLRIQDNETVHYINGKNTRPTLNDLKVFADIIKAFTDVIDPKNLGSNMTL